MKYTMTDVLAKASAIETRRAVIGERTFKINKDFDSRGLSHDNWLAMVYPDAKLFLKGLTKDNFIELLDAHREVKEKREQLKLSLERHSPILFQFMGEERIFPLEGGVGTFAFWVKAKTRPLKKGWYEKIQKSLAKKKKIESPVFFLVKEKPKLITLTEATRIITERNEREKEIQESKASSENSK